MGTLIRVGRRSSDRHGADSVQTSSKTEEGQRRQVKKQTMPHEALVLPEEEEEEEGAKDG